MSFVNGAYFSIGPVMTPVCNRWADAGTFEVVEAEGSVGHAVEAPADCARDNLAARHLQAGHVRIP